MAVAPSRGETGSGTRAEAKSRQAEASFSYSPQEKDEQSSLVMSKVQIPQRGAQ